jgi:hypothetical protein
MPRPNSLKLESDRGSIHVVPIASQQNRQPFPYTVAVCGRYTLRTPWQRLAEHFGPARHRPARAVRPRASTSRRRGPCWRFDRTARDSPLWLGY